MPQFSWSLGLGSLSSMLGLAETPANTPDSRRRQRIDGPVVICGASGVGKGTLIGRLLHLFPNDFGFSVSHTTRDPRPGEVDGKDYHFCDAATFKQAEQLGRTPGCNLAAFFKLFVLS